MAWTNSIFFDNAYNTHPRITFMYEASTALPFLDVLIKINNNTIYTTVYCKPTDRHSYLHYNCNHSIHLRHSIIFLEFLRYKKSMITPHRLHQVQQGTHSSLSDKGLPFFFGVHPLRMTTTSSSTLKTQHEEEKSMC